VGVAVASFSVALADVFLNLFEFGQFKWLYGVLVVFDYCWLLADFRFKLLSDVFMPTPGLNQWQLDGGWWHLWVGGGVPYAVTRLVKILMLMGWGCRQMTMMVRIPDGMHVF
jgi:hypothetical protein